MRTMRPFSHWMIAVPVAAATSSARLRARIRALSADCASVRGPFDGVLMDCILRRSREELRPLRHTASSHSRSACTRARSCASPRQNGRRIVSFAGCHVHPGARARPRVRTRRMYPRWGQNGPPLCIARKGRRWASNITALPHRDVRHRWLRHPIAHVKARMRRLVVDDVLPSDRDAILRVVHQRIDAKELTF
jgi:hypothetical protein